MRPGKVLELRRAVGGEEEMLETAPLSPRIPIAAGTDPPNLKRTVQAAVQVGEILNLHNELLSGSSRFRTCDPRRVKAMLYR